MILPKVFPAKSARLVGRPNGPTTTNPINHSPQAATIRTFKSTWRWYKRIEWLKPTLHSPFSREPPRAHKIISEPNRIIDPTTTNISLQQWLVSCDDKLWVSYGGRRHFAGAGESPGDLLSFAKAKHGQMTRTSFGFRLRTIAIPLQDSSPSALSFVFWLFLIFIIVMSCPVLTQCLFLSSFFCSCNRRICRYRSRYHLLVRRSLAKRSC